MVPESKMLEIIPIDQKLVLGKLKEFLKQYPQHWPNDSNLRKHLELILDQGTCDAMGWLYLSLAAYEDKSEETLLELFRAVSKSTNMEEDSLTYQKLLGWLQFLQMSGFLQGFNYEQKLLAMQMASSQTNIANLEQPFLTISERLGLVLTLPQLAHVLDYFVAQLLPNAKIIIHSYNHSIGIKRVPKEEKDEFECRLVEPNTKSFVTTVTNIKELAELIFRHLLRISDPDPSILLTHSLALSFFFLKRYDEERISYPPHESIIRPILGLSAENTPEAAFRLRAYASSRDSKGYSLFWAVADADDTQTLRFILERLTVQELKQFLALPDENQNPLMVMIKSKNLNCLRLLLQYLNQLTQKGELSLEEKLAILNFETSYPSTQTFLIMAALTGPLEMVRLLIQSGATFNHEAKNGRNALRTAIAWGHNDITQFLTELYQKNNFELPKNLYAKQNGDNILHSFARHNTPPKVINYLLDTMQPQNLKDSSISDLFSQLNNDGMPPLITALDYGHTSVLLQLLELADKYKISPLDTLSSRSTLTTPTLFTLVLYQYLTFSDYPEKILELLFKGYESLTQPQQAVLMTDFKNYLGTLYTAHKKLLDVNGKKTDLESMQSKRIATKEPTLNCLDSFIHALDEYMQFIGQCQKSGRTNPKLKIVSPKPVSPSYKKSPIFFGLSPEAFMPPNFLESLSRFQEFQELFATDVTPEEASSERIERDTPSKRPKLSSSPSEFFPSPKEPTEGRNTDKELETLLAEEMLFTWVNEGETFGP